jgi:OPA family glycerol-3-phosphate transporter-like MFS transporter
MSVWNTSHTIGSGSLGLLVTLGVAMFAALGVEQAWRAAFIFPGVIALALALFCWWALRDTPQSCGLPPVEEWRKDYTGKKSAKGEEQTIPLRRLFVDYIFRNKILWVIAAANALVYLVRYGVGDWAPVYLREMGIMDKGQSNLAFSLHNYAGVPGTIVCGWISAKFFRGRCAPANVIYMGLVGLGILMYWQAAPLAAWVAQAFGVAPAAACRGLVYASLCAVGFCIYGPVALVSVQALNLVPKNAAGTAAGFVGLFGYLIGDALLAKILMGAVAERSGWNATFWLLMAACAGGMALCAASWRKELEEAKGR